MNRQTGAPEVTSQVIKDSKLLVCPCGGKEFENSMIIKKISPILSPTGEVELFPMNILVCKSCGKVPPDLNPEGLIPQEFLIKKAELTDLGGNKL